MIHINIVGDYAYDCENDISFYDIHNLKKEKCYPFGNTFEYFSSKKIFIRKNADFLKYDADYYFDYIPNILKLQKDSQQLERKEDYYPNYVKLNENEISFIMIILLMFVNWPKYF